MTNTGTYSPTPFPTTASSAARRPSATVRLTMDMTLGPGSTIKA